MLVLARDTDNLAGSGRPVQLGHRRMGYALQNGRRRGPARELKPPAKFRRPAGGHGLGATTSTDDDGGGSSIDHDRARQCSAAWAVASMHASPVVAIIRSITTVVPII